MHLCTISYAPFHPVILYNSMASQIPRPTQHLQPKRKEHTRGQGERHAPKCDGQQAHASSTLCYNHYSTAPAGGGHANAHVRHCHAA